MPSLPRQDGSRSSYAASVLRRAACGKCYWLGPIWLHVHKGFPRLGVKR